MENAEEVMQLLEEFTKVKPKEIPKELEDYLGYVAKTGDPVYQWSLVKSLFREKLIRVITDFFESTLTVELPPCPNVEPFNYERMKNGLLERFDTFSSAPFTVQRICELLTNPRKEYNRADKYMRAIEKNILVVSTREPGTGKRPLESDNQQETILNGMPDGSLMHIPTDLPYLGAPPASNDVTVETSEAIVTDTVSDRVGLGLGIDINESKTVITDTDSNWPTQESSVSLGESEPAGSTSEILDVVETFNKVKSLDERSSDADGIFVGLNNCPESDIPTSDVGLESESSSSDMVIINSETVIPDTASIDSSDSLSDSSLDINKVQDKNNYEEAGNTSDENEVSSTPLDIATETLILEEELDEPSDSEAEATDNSIEQSVGLQSEKKLLVGLTDSEINSSENIIQTNETQPTLTVTEVTGSDKLDESGVECSVNEITGTVVLPVSPTSNSSCHSEDLKVEQNNEISVEESDQPDSHPDSSNDVSAQKEKSIISENLIEPDTATSEADSMSETNAALSDGGKCVSKIEPSEDTCHQQTDSEKEDVISPIVQVSSPSLDLNIEKSCEKILEEEVLPSSSIQPSIINEEVCLAAVIEEDSTVACTNSSNQVAEEIFDQEQREESVIHSLPNVASHNSKEMAQVEDISVDAGCEVEEEAMDVDDSSNQMMMISEGENEGEPMDQSDQLQS